LVFWYEIAFLLRIATEHLFIFVLLVDAQKTVDLMVSL